MLLHLMLGPLIALSSTSWLIVWMGLELNLLCSLPSMSSSYESKSKYYMAQAIASSLLLLALMVPIVTQPILTISFAMKAALAPFHFWLPPIMAYQNWFITMLMLTWQKLAPLMLLMHLWSMHTIVIIAVSVMSGPIFSLNQTSLKKLMTFSSINHGAWALFASISSLTLAYLYLLSYIFTSLSLMACFNQVNASHTPQLLSIKPKHKLMIIINVLNFMGFPPFLMFMLKLSTIFHLSLTPNLSLLCLWLLITSVMASYVYLGVFYFPLTTQYSPFKINPPYQASIPLLFLPLMSLMFLPFLLM